MFDSNTQVLTATGWIRIDTAAEQPLAAFDPVTAKFIGFDTAQLVSKPYTGPMLQIDGRVSLLCTPDQRLYASLSANTRLRYQPEYRLYRAIQELTGRFQADCIAEAPFRVRVGGTGSVMIDTGLHPFACGNIPFARLIGFAASDGHASRRSKDNLRFRLKKPRKLDYLADILAGCGLTQHAADPITYLVRYPGLGHWFWQALYLGKDKTLPVSLLSAAQPVLDAVLDGLKNGDGFVRSSTRWEYATVSRPLADMLQALSVIAGQPMSLKDKGSAFRLYSLTHGSQPHINDARSPLHRVTMLQNWQGLVYGWPELDALISIRREDKTMLIGAS